VRRGMERARRNERRTTYRVRSGDSLWSIARKHNVSVARLRRWNGLHKRKVIRPGQKLVIWRHRAPAKSRATARASAKIFTVHVVQSGDNLWTIARRYQLRSADLARWNGIKTTDTLQPGQELRLIPPKSA
jgi:membrane-bound lytic murein transglycosylase D